MTLKDLTIKPISGLKKTFVYSSEREKDFIEGVLNIHARAEKKTPSATLEDLVAKAVLPENEKASRICRKLYSSEMNNTSALASIFDMYAAGINNEAMYDNGLELVDFFHDMLISVEYPTDESHKGECKFFLSNFHEIVKKIEADLTSDYEDSLNVAESPVKYAKYELEEATNEPHFFKPINFTQLLRNYWDVLGNFTYTYRALAALCRLLEDQISDYAEDRINLVKVIGEVSQKWE